MNEINSLVLVRAYLYQGFWFTLSIILNCFSDYFCALHLQKVLGIDVGLINCITNSSFKEILVYLFLNMSLYFDKLL